MKAALDRTCLELGTDYIDIMLCTDEQAQLDDGR